jgi:DNA-binding transcriptional ArsR family regulator
MVEPSQRVRSPTRRASRLSASNHLAKLTEGGLLKVENQGRHRYYRLASPHVAMAIEALANLAPPIRSLATPLSREARSLRFGRSCYDHLAGRLGIAVTARLEAAGHLNLVDDDAKNYAVSEDGRHWFKALGIELTGLTPSSRGARPTLSRLDRAPASFGRSVGTRASIALSGARLAATRLRIARRVAAMIFRNS